MKPKDWDTMSPEARREDAMLMFGSMRGRLIMGQALAKAVAVMKTVEPAYMMETSNIQDMEELGETLFEPFFSMHRSDVA